MTQIRKKKAKDFKAFYDRNTISWRGMADAHRSRLSTEASEVPVSVSSWQELPNTHYTGTQKLKRQIRDLVKWRTRGVYTSEQFYSVFPFLWILIIMKKDGKKAPSCSWLPPHFQRSLPNIFRTSIYHVLRSVKSYQTSSSVGPKLLHIT